MNTTFNRRFCGQGGSLRASPLRYAIFSLALIVLGAQAQPVLGPAPTPLALPAAASGFKSAIPQTSLGGLTNSNNGAQGGPLKWGKAEVLPHFNYSYTYGDGIQSRPGSQSATSTHVISPGVAFKLGEWMLSYTATQTFYSDRNFIDTFDHVFTLNGGKAITKTIGNWVVGLNFSYSTSYAPQIETARQTKMQNVTSAVSAAYPLGGNFNVALGLNQNLRFSGDVGNALEWTSMNWLNYQGSSKFNTGAGVGFGYTDVAKGPDTKFSRALVRAGWQISRKVGLDFDGGIEARQTTTAGAPSKGTPIYNLMLHYAPFDFTTLSISGTRSKEISLFENRESESKRWSVNLSQRFLGRLNFSAGYSWQDVGYAPSATKTSTPARADQPKAFNVNLGTTLFKRCTLAVTHQKMENSSDATGFGFSSNQFGFQFGYTY